MILKKREVAAENSALPSQEQITFKIILKLKTFIFNCNNISQYCCFSVFLIKEMQLWLA